MKDVKKKYISSTYLKNVNEYDLHFLKDIKNNCYISIKKIISIKEPFCTQSSGCLIDNNYYIIEIVPLNENYCIRVFVDKYKKVILYYFDITLENGFDSNLNSPYYKDLFIDVILKNNQIKVLDEDELKEALEDEYIATLPIGYADGLIRANQGQNVKVELINSLISKTNKYIRIDFMKYLN